MMLLVAMVLVLAGALGVSPAGAQVGSPLPLEKRQELIQSLTRLMQEAITAFQAEDYPRALQAAQAGLEAAGKLGDKKITGILHLLMALTEQRQLRSDQALEHFRLALHLFQELGDREQEGIALTKMGWLLVLLWQPEQAQEHLSRALKLRKELQDKKGQGETLAYLGILYKNLSRYDQALKAYQEALALFRELKLRSEECITLNNLGEVHEAAARYEKALDYFYQSLRLARELKDKGKEGTALNNLAVVYENLGQLNRARECYQESLTLARQAGDLRLEGYALHNFGSVYDRLGRHQEALECYRQALASARKRKDRSGEARTLTNLGKVYLSLGQCDEALSHYQQALAIFQELKERPGEAVTLNRLGLLFIQQGRQAEALEALRRGLAAAREAGDPEAVWRAQNGLGALMGKLGRDEEAMAFYEQAIETIEALRAGLLDREARTSFMENKFFVYDECIELLVNLHQQYPHKGYDRKALEIFERKQGRTFLEEMGKSGARNFAGLPEEVRAKESDLEAQLESCRTLLVKARSQKDPDRQPLQELEGRLMQIRSELQSLKAKIEKDYPDYHALKYPRPATLKELQEKVLKTGEVLLVYGVMEKTTCLWLVSPQGFSFYPLNIGEQELHQKITSFRQGVLGTGEQVRGKPMYQARPEAPEPKVGRELHQILLPEGVRQSLAPGWLLYIVPTGPLYALPFEALETQGPDQPRRYLIQDHPVAYLSSASLLMVLREAQGRKKDKPAHPFLAFAHPVYPKTGPAAEGSSLRGLQHRAYRDQAGGEFSELPETADEVKEIQNILQAPEASQPLNLREQAARSRVLALHQEKKLAGYRYVVFASHGLLPGEVTKLVQPALALSYPEREGFLTMGDVFGLKLNADLVTLSACNTGRGTPVKGEGIMGLTRAFMYAGTPAVGVTLWSVESLSAKDLNVGLHRYLSQGLGRAEALRRIKLDMLQGEKEFGEKDYHHPYFWAPLVVFGDGQ